MSACGAILEVLNIDACSETHSRYNDPCSERAKHSQSQYDFTLNSKKKKYLCSCKLFLCIVDSLIF